MRKKIIISLIAILFTASIEAQKKTTDEQIKLLSSKWEQLDLNSKTLLRNALKERLKTIRVEILSNESKRFIIKEIWKQEI